MARIWTTFLFSGASAAFSLTGKLSDNRISSCLGRADDRPALSVPAGQEGVSYPSQPTQIVKYNRSHLWVSKPEPHPLL